MRSCRKGDGGQLCTLVFANMFKANSFLGMCSLPLMGNEKFRLKFFNAPGWIINEK